MNIAAYIIGSLGGVAGLVSIMVAIGRWVGRRDVGEDRISAEGRQARDETRQAVKRIEDNVGALKAEIRQEFERIGERLRPLYDRHAQQQTFDRDLSEVIDESRENRERIIRLEELGRRPRPSRPRNRKTGGS